MRHTIKKSDFVNQAMKITLASSSKENKRLDLVHEVREIEHFEGEKSLITSIEYIVSVKDKEVCITEDFDFAIEEYNEH